MELLILILLFIILYPLLRVAFSIWRQVHHIKKQFSDIREQFDEARNSQYRNTYYDDDDDDDSRSRRTQYVQSMGEYVDYEEIVEERITIAYDPDIPVEPQITDAHYEEID